MDTSQIGKFENILPQRAAADILLHKKKVIFLKPYQLLNNVENSVHFPYNVTKIISKKISQKHKKLKFIFPTTLLNWCWRT